MRVDKFLKVSRLIKRRTVAKEACEKGRILVNGRVAKAGTEVAPGDTLSLQTGSRTLEFRILAVKEHVKKEEATELYEEIGQQE